MITALGLLAAVSVSAQAFPAVKHPRTQLLRIEMALRKSVTHLAGTIGERNLRRPQKLAEAAAWIEAEWKAQGLAPERHGYDVGGVECVNVDVHVAGPKTGPVVVVGAHYDSVTGCPGADDNASGVAAMLEISRALARRRASVGVRCVAFVNEEPPYFESAQMGSKVYARMIRARKDEVRAMISLETMGYYRTTAGSQRYPPLLSALYPDAGNFVAVVGNEENREAVTRLGEALRKAQSVPVETAAFPGALPGISWSDHASFWEVGFPGVMVTDTALYRNPNYHRGTDTPGTVDYQRMAEVTAGMVDCVWGMVR